MSSYGGAKRWWDDYLVRYFMPTIAGVAIVIWIGHIADAGVARVLTRFVLKYTLRAAHLELGGVDLDLAVEDDVLPLDRADMTQQVGVEREVRRGGKP